MTETYSITNSTQTALVRGINEGRRCAVGGSGTFSNATGTLQYLSNSTWVTYSGGQTLPNGTFTSAREEEYVNIGENSSWKLAGSSVEAATYVNVTVSEI